MKAYCCVCTKPAMIGSHSKGYRPMPQHISEATEFRGYICSSCHKNNCYKNSLSTIVKLHNITHNQQDSENRFIKKADYYNLSVREFKNAINRVNYNEHPYCRNGKPNPNSGSNYNKVTPLETWCEEML